MVIDLLDDASEVVVEESHQALVKLTGQDFGPAPGFDAAARLEALTAWRGWWEQQQPKGKKK